MSFFSARELVIQRLLETYPRSQTTTTTGVVFLHLATPSPSCSRPSPAVARGGGSHGRRQGRGELREEDGPAEAAGGVGDSDSSEQCAYDNDSVEVCWSDGSVTQASVFLTIQIPRRVHRQIERYSSSRVVVASDAHGRNHQESFSVRRASAGATLGELMQLVTLRPYTRQICAKIREKLYCMNVRLI